MLSSRKQLYIKAKPKSNLQAIPEVASPNEVVGYAISGSEPVPQPQTQVSETSESTNIFTTTITPSKRRQMASRKGPSKPNFKRLLEIANKTQDEVAAALGIDKQALSNLLSNKVDAVERWAPVFAKVAVMSRKGMLKLLGITNDADLPATQSVGEVVYECLRQRGEQTLQHCRQALIEGWRGWERYRLTEEQLAEFFSGKSKEAEQVAVFLVKLGQATDPSSLFALFVR
eukprot:TRINITY_DN4878_c0_g1_i1.p1 TRINITY_DN4878_c0_g1~~TRINITY_DN4878_c0_g1_i1.p1  ORF type:complete len:230 (+),score=37.55 TRINITY_DN4878_c0_g1_i1:133-822(+)